MELPIGNVYQQSPRDERSTQWGPFNFSLIRFGTTTGFIIGGPPSQVDPWSIPPGYVAHIRSLALLLDPGAGQNVVNAFVIITDDNLNILLQPWALNTALGADVILNETVPVDLLLIGERHYIALTADFNSGVASNLVQFSAQSILMPKGNVASF